MVFLLFRSLLTVSVLLLVAGPAIAAASQTAQVVPLDPAVRTGKLPNGLTYYIRANQAPQKQISMMLSVKAGNGMEDQDQLHVAHLLEHVVHHGSSKRIGEFARSGGTTAADHTSYWLTIPSGDQQIIGRGLQLLREWAHGRKITPEIVDAERGVVLGEARGATELRRKYEGKLFGNTWYGKSLDKVRHSIATVPVESVQRFYTEWYRPDLQAVIVVGDIDVDRTQRQIEALFADIERPTHRPRDRDKLLARSQGELDKGNRYFTIENDEVSNVRFQVYRKHKSRSLKTRRDFRYLVLGDLYNELAAARFGRLLETYQPPFRFADHKFWPGTGNRQAGLDALYTEVTPDVEGIGQGFRSAMIEVERIRRFGFTLGELAFGKEALARRYARETHGDSDSLVRSYNEHFIGEAAAPAPQFRGELKEVLLNEIKLPELNSTARKWVDTPWTVLAFAPTNERESLPGEQSVSRWMADVNSVELAAYQEPSLESKPLIAPEKVPHVPARVYARVKEIDELGVTWYGLGNGVEVVLKPFKPEGGRANTILVHGISPGGASIYSGQDCATALMAPFIIQESGVGNLDKFELARVLKGKTVKVFPYVRHGSEGIRASANSDDLETMFQLIHQYFVSPNMNAIAFQNWQKAMLNEYRRREQDPWEIYKAASNRMWPQHSCEPELLRAADIAAINPESAYDIYRDRFGDAGDFTFVITGDFDRKGLSPLIFKYLATLPAAARSTDAEPLRTTTGDGNLTEERSKTLYAGDGDVAKVSLRFAGRYPVEPINNLLLDIIGEMVRLSMYDRLREKEGGTYLPNAGAGRSVGGRYEIYINFDTSPEDVDRMIAAAKEEVIRLRADGPDASLFRRAVAGVKETLESRMKDNSWTNVYLSEQYLQGEDPREILERRALLEKLTLQQVKDAARTYLSSDAYGELVMMPERFAPPAEEQN